MTSIQPQTTEHDSNAASKFDINLPEMDVAATESPTVSFGSRLHAAREARGLDLESCGHALKLPARVLRQLERDQYDGIDSKVYLASYISKYGRHLGINEASIQVELDRIKQIEPTLVVTGGVSHSRYLVDRYLTAATYVVLTGVIVVPLIWYGLRGTLNHDLSHLSPLDSTPVTLQSGSAATSDTPAAAPAITRASSNSNSAPAQDQPLLASMAPFPNLGAETLRPAAVTAVVPEQVAGAHSLSLKLSEPSWVEVTQADGTRLEYNLLPAGSNTTYHSDQALDVSIGNVGGARVSLDGRTLELGNFRRANVAHFSVEIEDGKASANPL